MLASPVVVSPVLASPVLASPVVVSPVVLPTGSGGVTQTARYDPASRVTHVDASGPTTRVG